MPKRISWETMYTTSWFALIFQLTADVILSVKYQLYGYFGAGIDIKSFILTLLLYPTYNAIFLNFFPKASHWKQALYIIGNTIIITCYEYAILQTDAFYYSGWKLWYSAISYPAILLLLYGNFRVTKWLHKKSVQN